MTRRPANRPGSCARPPTSTVAPSGRLNQMAYSVTGTAGNDTLNQTGDTGPGTIVGLAGNDCIFSGTGAVTVDAGSGEDTFIPQAGNTGQASMGTENDSIYSAANIGSMV